MNYIFIIVYKNKIIFEDYTSKIITFVYKVYVVMIARDCKYFDSIKAHKN